MPMPCAAADASSSCRIASRRPTSASSRLAGQHLLGERVGALEPGAPGGDDVAHEEQVLEAGLDVGPLPPAAPALAAGLVLDLAGLLRTLVGEFGAEPVEHRCVARDPVPGIAHPLLAVLAHLPAP